jgi:hypothetical protein
LPKSFFVHFRERSLTDDGAITANELRKIDREGGELVAKLQMLLATVRARHLATSPAAKDAGAA